MLTIQRLFALRQINKFLHAIFLICNFMVQKFESLVMPLKTAKLKQGKLFKCFHNNSIITGSYL